MEIPSIDEYYGQFLTGNLKDKPEAKLLVQRLRYIDVLTEEHYKKLTTWNSFKMMFKRGAYDKYNALTSTLSGEWSNIIKELLGLVIKK